MDELKRLLEEAKQRFNNAKKALQDINVKFDGLYDESSKAANVEELESVKAKMEVLRQQKTLAQERVKDSESEVKSLEVELAEKSKAKLPATMPNLGLDEGTMVSVPTEKQDNPTTKAVSNIRYGELEPAVKAVITDLYGNDYDNDRMEQIKAFNLYMRGRDHQISQKGWDLLRKIILTPDYVKSAILAGVDVSFMKSTMVEAIDTLGGYTVPVDYVEKIIQRKPGMVVMRGRAMQMNTSRDRVQIPVATGGDDQYTSAIRVTWVDETPSSAAVSETNPTWGLEGIPVNTAMATVPMSKNLLEDSAFNLSSYVTEQFANAKLIAEDNAFLTGDGVGKPQGVLIGGLAPTAGVTVVNSGAAATLTFNGLIALMFGIASQYKSGAVWIAERQTYQIIAQLQDNEGNYLWTEMRGNNASGLPNTLRGFPVLEQQSMPTVAAGTYPLLFGNPDGYQIVDRLGMTVQRFDVLPGQNTLQFELKWRVGGQLVAPWQMAAQLVSA